MDAYELTEKAVRNGAIRDLLVGDGGYGFVPKYSPTDQSTDLAILLPDGLYPFAEKHPELDIRGDVEKALRELISTVPGLTAFALVLMLESVRIGEGKRGLGLDRDALSDLLKSSIQANMRELVAEQKFGGRGFSDGAAGNLRRLSNITKDAGGPGFFPAA